MFELIKAGGWVMWPIILCSVAALAIIGERFWSLQKKYVTPPDLLAQVMQLLERNELEPSHLAALRDNSPLGRILAAGLVNRDHDREIVKEAIENTGRHVVPDLERYLRSLGTIAAISPFLGLFGTVIGMIQMFSGIGQHGVGDPSIVAAGISTALITTAAGIAVAIPSVMFYRYFRGRVNELIINMESEAIKLVEVLQGERERESD
ncbi:MAG: MotA/TolQ/ExbB proton channel family protein [Gammaproteobacteria bacterium]|nr:MotA/TolQ/ExbB proton channel family protein [Gammaproteobacteria bacterium]MDH3371525.1 MotA/TolQ/ExbB proton channel family protein [Gammaproteobacteria bacterium]MDH3405912.1 MotA/TolQ/ExbB proton channel family protein [Gammaproteobacteria bacterium]MDH3563357.1 MotA/TolQ/ExbB proton channel family protein [Gammaproteobacteria bacterium]MDH5486670.1 MotA/TolQ/ExbB proton channel family protein [Gammaproteobacteria bacterium]